MSWVSNIELWLELVVLCPKKCRDKLVLVPYGTLALTNFGLEPRERTQDLGFSLSIYTPDPEAKRGRGGPRRAHV